MPQRSASDIRAFVARGLVARRLYGGRIESLSISPVETAVSCWYVAQVKPRREKLAISHLERQGFETYCPLVARSKLTAKKPTLVREPLFPGYVFVKLGTEQRWRSINGAIGIIKLVTFGNEPKPALTGFVERLQGMAIERGVISFKEGLEAGDAVRFVGAPLTISAASWQVLQAATGGRLASSPFRRDPGVSPAVLTGGCLTTPMGPPADYRSQRIDLPSRAA